MALARVGNAVHSFVASARLSSLPAVARCTGCMVQCRERGLFAVASHSCALSIKRFHGSGARVAKRTPRTKPEFGASRYASLDAALRCFEAEVGKPEHEVQLSRAVALLALHTDPSIDLEESIFQPLESLRRGFLERVAMLESVAGPLSEAARQESLAAALCSYLTAQGFRGCGRSADEYYRPENSLLNVVLKTKKAIPITLSVVYLDVASACGLELWGANFPGHFMLGFGSGSDAGLIDAFDGRSASASEANDVLSELFGRPVNLDPAWSWQLRVPKILILRRMVLNLQHVYSKTNDANLANVNRFAQILDQKLQPAC
eukprot:TRINITY_DN23135_c0_g1_i1.p1 TRINITY_DN23135_c0_g1~~TRINITY_DN23135_c0_g1_i1.p1  ORF type:complete len:319 (-),score=32.83 TRINITY_DN23135_c0_g1_i1:2-958(-)